MRRVALTLALLSLSSLAFAPAPLPRRDREAREQRRALADCAAALEDLGVRWELVGGPGGPELVRFSVEGRRFGRSAVERGVVPVNGDLARALRAVIRQARAFRHYLQRS